MMKESLKNEFHAEMQRLAREASEATTIEELIAICGEITDIGNSLERESLSDMEAIRMSALRILGVDVLAGSLVDLKLPYPVEKDDLPQQREILAARVTDVQVMIADSRIVVSLRVRNNEASYTVPVAGTDCNWVWNKVSEMG